MSQDNVRLSYRELADRFNISVDAARMKAKRAAKKGIWRIIAGNHPSDRVLVEVPISDIPDVDGVGGEQKPSEEKVVRGERVHQKTELELASRMQEQIQSLTDQLFSEMERHRHTAIQLSEMKTLQASASVEIQKLTNQVSELEDEIDQLTKPWWRRIF